jgi:hypothetical protein
VIDVGATVHATTNAITVLAEGVAAGIAGAGAAAALIMHGLHAAGAIFLATL